MPARAAAIFLETLDGEGLSVGAFEDPLGEVDGEASTWRVEILHRGRPDQAQLVGRLAAIAERAGVSELDLVTLPVPEQDWVARTAAQFPPQRIGRFWVYGSHVDQPVPDGSVPILVEAGLAFGSGEHATTRSCLLALDRIATQRRLGRVLDLGCGSGILAIAAAKCWPARIIAADVDPAAARVAGDNASANQVGGRIRAVASNGLDHALVRRRAPYDLVLANILAGPLIRLAPAISKALDARGQVVLSGLLDRQVPAVLAAYRPQGLRVAFRVEDGPWTTLVLSRRRRSRGQRKAAPEAPERRAPRPPSAAPRWLNPKRRQRRLAYRTAS